MAFYNTFMIHQLTPAQPNPFLTTKAYETLSLVNHRLINDVVFRKSCHLVIRSSCSLQIPNGLAALPRPPPLVGPPTLF